jgi:hypothetical protein
MLQSVCGVSEGGGLMGPRLRLIVLFDLRVQAPILYLAPLFLLLSLHFPSLT